MRSNSTPLSGGKSWLNKVSRVQSALQWSSHWASFKAMKNGKGGALRQAAWSNAQLLICSIEKERECNNVYIHTIWSHSELVQHRESGMQTLAYCANCNSFALAPLPTTLNTHVKCVYNTSTCMCICFSARGWILWLTNKICFKSTFLNMYYDFLNVL